MKLEPINHPWVGLIFAKIYVLMFDFSDAIPGLPRPCASVGRCPSRYRTVEKYPEHRGWPTFSPVTGPEPWALGSGTTVCFGRHSHQLGIYQTFTWELTNVSPHAACPWDLCLEAYSNFSDTPNGLMFCPCGRPWVPFHDIFSVTSCGFEGSRVTGNRASAGKIKSPPPPWFWGYKITQIRARKWWKWWNFPKSTAFSPSKPKKHYFWKYVFCICIYFN